MLQTFLATLTPMLTLFLCIAVGFVANKTKILPESASKTMAKMETWIFCPALSFMTMVRFCTVDTISTHATNIVMASMSVACAMAIAIPLAKVFVKTDCPERGVYAYALAFANSGYVGDPIVLALFGEEGLGDKDLIFQIQPTGDPELPVYFADFALCETLTDVVLSGVCVVRS